MLIITSPCRHPRFIFLEVVLKISLKCQAVENNFSFPSLICEYIKTLPCKSVRMIHNSIASCFRYALTQ